MVLTNKDYVAHFENYLLNKKCVSPNTFVAYGQDLKQLLYFLSEHEYEVRTCSLYNLEEFLEYLYDQKKSPRSIARKITVVKGFFSYLHETFGIKNSAQKLVLPKFKKKLPVYISEQEMEQLFQAAQRDTSSCGKRNTLMLYLMYATGLRVTELINLEITDLDFNKRIIDVRGDGKRHRAIPIPAIVFDMIRVYLAHDHAQFVTSNGATEFLFPIVYDKKIRPLSRHAFWGIIKNMWQNAGLKSSVSPQKIRHSFATHMLSKGADLKSLQILLGHEHVSSIEIYTQIETDYLRKIYDKKHPRS